MNDPPRITIVTPNFNQAEYIEETIRSVLDQHYPALEYIIVDGGSDDGSVEIIKRYESHLAWWASERDKGQADALNKGFARATGDVFGFINSDDLLEPGALERVGRAFQEGAEWVAGGVRLFGANMADEVKTPKREKQPMDWLLRNMTPQQGSFWSSSLARRAGPFRVDLWYVFDYEYWVRLRLKLGAQPTIVPETLAAFRMRESSKTCAEGAGFVPEIRQVQREYAHRLSASARARFVAARARHRARWRLNRSIAHASQGRRVAALASIAGAAAAWPPMLLSRRAGGALRRALTQSDPEERTGTKEASAASSFAP